MILNDLGWAGRRSDRLGQCSDDVATAVIANELAHIILRHTSMSYLFALVNNLGCDQDGAWSEVHDVHKWEEDLQAWLWGGRVMVTTNSNIKC